MKISSRPTLILIPGLLCDQSLWEEQVCRLDRLAEVIIADVTQQQSIEEMAAAILEVAHKTFSLAGFSLGGQVALEIVRMARERVDRLALLSTTRGGLPLPVHLALTNAISTIEAGKLEEYLARAFSTYFSAAHADDSKLKEHFMAMGRSVGSEAGMRQMRALLAITHPFSGLDHIKSSTLVLAGREYCRTTPEAQELLAKDIPGADLIIVDGAAHFTPLEQPSFVCEKLEQWISSPSRIKR